MAKDARDIALYLEVGKKRVLAGAIEWPGWCRGGRDEHAALQALLNYAPRYERVLVASGIPFKVPESLEPLTIAERLEGTTTTDFGAPDVQPSGDALPVEAAELRRLQALLQACWS